MNARPGHALLAAALCLAAALPARAQVEVHRHLNVEDGLVQTQVNAILEDRGGFVWFGTFGGLSRWDGVTFRNFQLHDGLSGLDVRVIYECDDGRLLVGTGDAGITAVDGVTLRAVAARLPGNSVRDIKRGPGGRVWIATDGGLAIYPDESLDSSAVAVLLEGMSVSSVAHLEPGVACVTTFRDGLFLIRGDTASRIDRDGGLPSAIIRYVHRTAAGTVLVSVYHGGMWVLDGDSLRVWEHSDALGENDVKCIHEGRDGTVYFSTLGGGIGVWRGGRVEMLTTANGLGDMTSWAVHEGRSGVVYLGTWNGVDLWRPGQMTTWNEATGLRTNVVTAIEEGAGGEVYIGSAGGGLTVIRDGAIDTLYSVADGLSNNRVWALDAARDGTLYIGTHAGVDVMRGGVIDTLWAHGNSLEGRVYGIAEGDDGSVYFASYNGAFVHRDGVTTRLFAEDDRERSTMHTVAVAPDGTVYFGTARGVLAWDGTAARVVDAAGDVGVWSILPRGNGTVLLGTNGAGLLTVRVGAVDTLDARTGLSENTVFGILEDDSGRLYLSTHRGVNVVDTGVGNAAVRVIDHRDGLASNECNQGAYLRDSDGRMWFGTIRGASCYNPFHDPPNEVAPRIHITRVGLFENEIPRARLATPFHHDQNYFKFDFVATNPRAPAKVRYRYRLSGVDRDWVETDRRFVQYTALDDGDYTFELAAGNGWGVWSGPEAVTFSIAAPFWETWWFIAAVVLAVGGTIALVVTYRVRHLLAFERLRTRIAADLHDDIGAGLTEISIMSEVVNARLPEGERDRVGRELSRIGNASRQLVDSMADIVWLVNPARDSLHDLVARLGDSYKELLNAAGVTFHVDNVDALDRMRLPMEQRQHVFLIFKEAINNAIKYSGCTELSLTAALNGRRLEMTLRDNGTGFDPDSTTDGNGLANMRHRADAIGGALTIESAPGAGTAITLSAPIR